MEMRWLPVAAGSVIGAVLFTVAPLLVLGEMIPSLAYEAALPILLASCLVGVLLGGYLGRRSSRSKRRQG
jgi:hypothetical protein